VHFWHADPRGQYDAAGFKFRGRQITDAQGRYRVTTFMPGPSGSRAPHVGVRVRIAGKPDFWTEMFFPNQPLNAKDVRYRAELVATPRADGLTFDITLNM
jgi:protocatechuate 3,4-dioxygenase beta subunit